MSKVVEFEPAARRIGAVRRVRSVEPRARLSADAWVSGAAVVAASTCPQPPPAMPERGEPSLGECLGQLQRDCAAAWRGPAERQVAGLVRLAACRTPMDFSRTQLALAHDSVARSFEETARIAESFARAQRAAAKAWLGGWG
ncbi:hypothetical protein [Salinarimonas ramus]|uniref:Phasin protein n=1 Tax=Salinarimonas ramus TaxID=690164 RepID=A0A917V222_9HYPH|nr:hypothetical protein [Salinarimonas ramus]GGK19349.1 hypothetical protein GCM10011322_02560 [Salinarimonas ramus]